MRDLPSYNAVPSLGGAFLHFPRGYPIYIQCAGSSYSNFILALLAEEPNFPVAGRLFSLSLLHLFLHFNALAFPPLGLDFLLPEKHPCILPPADATACCSASSLPALLVLTPATPFRLPPQLGFIRLGYFHLDHSRLDYPHLDLPFWINFI